MKFKRSSPHKDNLFQRTLVTEQAVFKERFHCENVQTMTKNISIHEVEKIVRNPFARPQIVQFKNIWEQYKQPSLGCTSNKWDKKGKHFAALIMFPHQY